MSLAALAYARRSWRVFGSGAAPDAFAIGGASPELVAAFTTASDGTTAGEYYRKASSETTFDGLFTHSVSSPLTMFDSSGTLVWAPHNYALQSVDLSAVDDTIGATVSGTPTETIEGIPLYTITEDTSTGLHRFRQSDTFPANSKMRVSFCYKAGTRRYFAVRRYSSGEYAGLWSLDIDTTTNTIDATSNVSNTSITQIGTSAMYRVSFTVDERTKTTATTSTFYLQFYDDTKTSSYTGTNETVLLGAISLSNAELDMADNPDQTVSGLEKYVPTTSAAKFLPRRQAYRYNSGWELAGMQMEAAAATNLYDYGNLLASVWTEVGGTLVDANATLLGTANLASTFTEDTSTGLHRFYDFVPGGAVAGVTYTYSLHLKANGRSKVQVTPGSGSMGAFTHDFDLSAGTAVETSAGTSGQGCGIIDLGSGEYRIYGSWTQVSNGANGVVYALHNGTGTIYTGDGSSGVIAYGAQIETGLTPTSYIPTNGSTVTRAAETLSIAGADTPANTTAMTYFIKGLMTYADNNQNEYELLRHHASATELVRSGYFRTNVGTGQFQFFQEESNVQDFVVGGGSDFAPGVNVPFSIASRNTSTELNAAINGTALTANTTPTALPDLSATALQFCVNIASSFNGYISEFRMWGTDIGDSGIVEVTT